MRAPARRFCALLVLLGLLACGDRDAAFDRTPELVAQVALRDFVVLIDESEPRALLIDVRDQPLARPLEVELPPGPLLALRRSQHDEALIVCTGRRADETHAQEPAALVRLLPGGAPVVYALGSPFDRLEQSPDGRYAFLYRSKTAMAERLLGNLSEIAVVDLEREPAAGAVTLRTLRSQGDSPDSVLFSPSLAIAGEDRQLAVVLSAASVSLLDLGHLDRVETTVPLSDEGNLAVTPQQVLFDARAPALYVRSSAARDVFVLELTPRSAGEASQDGAAHNDFRPFIDQLAIGANPSDMALFEAQERARVLVLANGKSARVFDPVSGEADSVQLPRQAARVLAFTAASPRDREAAQRALLYAEGQSSLTFLDLEGPRDAGASAVDTLSLQRPLRGVVAMLEQERVLVLHDGQNVSLVDLVSRSAVAISSPVAVSAALVDGERRRAWIGPAGQTFVAWIDLDRGATHEIRLEFPIERLLPMFESGLLAIVHQDSLGLVTLLDVSGQAPGRGDARSIRGFLAAGLLDER